MNKDVIFENKNCLINFIELPCGLFYPNRVLNTVPTDRSVVGGSTMIHRATSVCGWV